MTHDNNGWEEDDDDASSDFKCRDPWHTTACYLGQEKCSDIVADQVNEEGLIIPEDVNFG